MSAGRRVEIVENSSGPLLRRLRINCPRRVDFFKGGHKVVPIDHEVDRRRH